MPIPGMLTSLISPLINITKWLYEKFKKPEPTVILRHRQDIRQKFEMHLPKKDQYGTHGEVIIRDLNRMDDYPDIKKRSKGISPWFKVEVKGLYHRGRELFLSMARSIKYDEATKQWELVEHDGPGTIVAFPVGRIPFDNVAEVVWDGDEYYQCPHIFCHFRKGEPYEEILYYAQQGEGEHIFYLPIEGFDPRQKRRFWPFS